MTNKLTKQEQERLYTQEGAFAALMGYIQGERGKVAPAVFNKLAAELSYPKQKKEDLVRLANEIEGDEELTAIYTKALAREVTLDDIPNAIAEMTVLEEKALHSSITNFLVDDQATKDTLRQLRYYQKKATTYEMYQRELKQSLIEELKGMPKAKYLRTPVTKPIKGKETLVLALSDLHIGFESKSMATGDYNFDVLVRSVQSIIDHVLEVVEKREIEEVYLVCLGDLVENSIMRASQAYEVEFPLAEQEAKALRLFIDMLKVLSDKVHVTFSVIAGNHDRKDANKKETLHNNNVVYTLLDNLFTIQESLGQLPNVTLIDNRSDVSRFDLNIAGKRVVGSHGDHLPKGNEKINSFMRDGKEVDILLTGHLHTTSVRQESFHRFQIQVGSTIGENHYSRQNMFPSTGATQMMLILREGYKSFEMHPLLLNDEGYYY